MSTSHEKTPLLVSSTSSLSAPLREDKSLIASNLPSSAPQTVNNHEHLSGQGKVRVGLDSSVLEMQKKWKQLTDINDENSTAKDMANEVQIEFEALRFQKCGIQTADFAQSHIIDDKLSIDYTPEAIQSPTMDKFRIAAAFIRDGIHGRKIGYRLDKIALFLYESFHSTLYRNLYTMIVLISCGLAFVERPGEQNEYVMVDLICTGLFGIDVYIRWTMSSSETKRKFISRQPWACVRMGLLLLTLLDLVLNWMLPQLNPYRYTRALRPFFLITRRRNIRIIFGSCLRALREVLIVLLLMFCLIGFFGLLGYLLFSDLSGISNAPYFASLNNSLYTMLLIQNCLPYLVKALYPYYKQTEWSSLFFIVFVCLTHLFLMKLTIAVSYKSYKTHTEKMLYKRLQKRKAALHAAFEILALEVKTADLERGGKTPPSSVQSDRRGSSRFFSSFVRSSVIRPKTHSRISLDTWIKVCKYLKPQWASTECTLVFNTIDTERIGYLDLPDFYQLCSFISVNVERQKPSMAATIFHSIFPNLRKRTVRRWQIQLRGLLLHEKVFFKKYRIIVAELVVGVLICLSVVQAIQVNNITLAFSVNRSWRIFGIILLCLFTAEVLLKLFAFGRREFFGRPFCKLDLGIVAIGWVFYVITTMKDPPQVSLVFYDLALATRSLRILKLLNLFPPFHEILWTMKRIMPLIFQLLLVIFSFMYAFAIITQANYGLSLSTFPLKKKELALPWYSVKEEFQVDTFAETLVTLFGVANLAGWDIVMDAAHAITQSNSTYVFFFTYRIVMANLLLPIFVGFLVESFVSNAKHIENTIETYVEAAQQRTLEDERLALLQDKDATPRRQPSSPGSDRDRGFRMRFERKGSEVQSEMFDAVRLSDTSRLKLLLEKKDEEIAQHEMEIRKLEGNMIGLQSRLHHAKCVILAYESKMEELSTEVQLRRDI